MKKSRLAIIISFIIISFMAHVDMVHADNAKIQIVSETYGPVTDAYANNDYAYLCAGGLLIILDVKDPSKPTQVGQVITPGTAWKIQVSGNYAYIANGSEGGLRIIDVSNPTNPKEAGFCITPGTARGIYVSDNYAYIADDSYGLRVIDISNSTRPKEVGFFDMPGYTDDVYVSGNHAYVISFIPDEMISSFHVLDISDPKNPSEVGFYRAKYMNKIYVSGDYAYVGGDGIRVIDISNPENPQEVGSYTNTNDEERLYGINIKGNYAYTADNAKFLVLDISDPNNPKNFGDCEIPDYSAENVFVIEDYAYVADQDGGLRVVNVSDPKNPKEIGAFDVYGSVKDIFVSGNYAYVLGWSKGLGVVDISNTDRPKLVGYCDISDLASSVFVSGKYAYIGNMVFDPFGGGFWIIDISDPTNPRKEGFIDCQAEIEAVYVSGNYAFAVDDYTNLHVIDISKTKELKEIGFIRLNGFSGQIQVTGELGRYAYISNSEGLYILDVANRKNPEVIGKYSIGAFIYETFVSGNYAYVAAGEKGFRVLDVTDPQKPDEVGFLDIPGATGVYVSENFAYVISNFGGTITMIDISDPRNPREALVYAAPGWWTRRVYVSNSYIYTADIGNGLCILRQTEWSIQSIDKQPITWGKIRQNELMQNYPNPFNPETWIPFVLSDNANVEIVIYDISEKLVRKLNLGYKPAGTYLSQEKAVYWDGKNEGGEKVTSGVYFYTIKAGNYTETRKMILID